MGGVLAMIQTEHTGSENGSGDSENKGDISQFIRTQIAMNADEENSPESKFEFIVYVVRSCATLLDTVLNHEGGHSQVLDNVITDAGLLARGEYLVDRYIAQNAFPKILIIDDILVYGRAINSILSELETLLLQLFCEENIMIERSVLRKELAKSISIRVYTRIGHHFFLIPEYQQCLTSEKILDDGQGLQSKISQINDINEDILNIIYSGDTTNTAYTISANLEDDGNAICIAESLLNMGFSETQPNLFSANSETGSFKQSLENYKVFQRFYPNKESPKVICTVRMFEKNEKSWVIPYVYFSNCSEAEFSEILSLIDNKYHLKFGGKILNELNIFDRMQCELLAMILNYKILQTIFSFADIHLDVSQLNLRKVEMNFGGYEYCHQFFEQLLASPVASSTELDEVFSDICKRIFSNFGVFPEKTIENDLCGNIVNRTTYKRSVAAEIVAYRLFHGGLTSETLQRGCKISSLQAFLSHVYEEAAMDENFPNLEKVIAHILILMDYDYLATITRKVTSNTQEKVVAHMIRASEYALTLAPKMYKDKIPMLVEMERHCINGLDDIQKQIEQYVAEYLGEPILANHLWDFVQSIYDQGQTIKDIDIFGSDTEYILKRYQVESYKDWYYTF